MHFNQSANFQEHGSQTMDVSKAGAQAMLLHHIMQRHWQIHYGHLVHHLHTKTSLHADMQRHANMHTA